MKIRFQKRDISLFFSLFILTLAGSTWAIDHGLDRILEYISYAILLTDILFNFLTCKTVYNKWNKFLVFIIVSFLFSFGLCVQKMSLEKLFPLLMTMLAISISSLLSEAYLNSYKRIKTAADAVLWGNVVAIAISTLLGYPILQWHSEFNTYAFTGGIYTKNYFGADMLIVFIGNYLAERKSSKANQKVIILFSALMLLLSNSRGALIMFFGFLAFMQITFVRRITKHQRKIFTVTILLLCIAMFVILFQEIALNSFNYLMRIKGFQNYIHHPDTDITRLLIGNAKELYVNDLDYVTQFRKLYGWDGSVEFALLDILIKNGIIGLTGYIIIFFIFIRAFVNSDNWNLKSSGTAIAVMLLVSMLVETYIQTIHSPVGIFCYLAMGGIAGMCNRESAEGKVNKFDFVGGDT